MSIKRDISMRVGVVYLFMLVFALVIGAKLVFLQFINDDKWKQEAEKTSVKNVEIEAHRGDVLSDDFRLLASSIPYYNIRMDFRTPSLTKTVFSENVDSLSIRMAQLFRDKSANTYKKEFEKAYKKGSRYYLVKRNVDYLDMKAMTTFPIFNRGRFKGGFIVEQTTVRKKPHGSLAARTVGYTTNTTKVGLEGAFDTYLGGQKGLQRMQKLSGGVWMPLHEGERVEPRDGSTIVTTINVDLQDVAEKALLRQLQKHGAGHGCVVVMEVNTGDVKAIVNLEKSFEYYSESYNFAVGESTEPGSTFKLPALVAAIEDGFVDINDTIDTENGRYEYIDKVISDSKLGGYGKITVQEVFEKSSNIGMAKIITSAYASQPHRFVDRLYGMGLNKPLGIPIFGEGEPVMHYPGDKNWSGFTIASMSYGYALSLTPLQILTFYNAVANDGKMVKPRFVTEIRRHGKIERVFHVEVLNPSICSKSTLKKVQTLMVGVVENGTATNLKHSSLKIAGKTGTARIYDKDYGYSNQGKVSHQASFAGYFPAENPKYSCIVVVNAPSRSVYYANEVAGPVFQEIANKVYASNIELQKDIKQQHRAKAELPYSKNGVQSETVGVLKNLGIKTKRSDADAQWISTQKEDKHIELQKKKIIPNLMPNVVSMGLKDALFLLENMGLVVEAKGRGSIKRQSIPVGSRIKKGDKVILEMSFIEEV